MIGRPGGPGGSNEFLWCLGSSFHSTSDSRKEGTRKKKRSIAVNLQWLARIEDLEGDL